MKRGVNHRLHFCILRVQSKVGTVMKRCPLDEGGASLIRPKEKKGGL
jgi:hypothetical protein